MIDLPRQNVEPVLLDRIIVGLRDASEADHVLVDCGGSRLDLRGKRLLVEVSPAEVADVFRRYLEHPLVADVMFDREVRATAAMAPRISDLIAYRNYGLWRMSIPQAWKRTKGNSAITALVMDSGIRPDPELPTEVLPRLQYFPPDKLGVNETLTTSSMFNHGTCTASVIVGAENGDGVVGIAPLTKVRSLRVLDVNGVGSLDNVMAAMQWAGTRGYRVINLSLGIGEAIPPETLLETWYGDVFDAAEAGSDPLFVAAVGNDGTDDGNDQGGSGSGEPAGMCAVRRHMAAGALSYERLDRPAWYSNHGYYPNILAPSHTFPTAPAAPAALSWPGAPVGWRSKYDNAYATALGSVQVEWVAFNGTSCAAPCISGVAALCLGVNQNLSHLELNDILLRTVDRPQDEVCRAWFRGPKYGVPGIGVGVVNAEKAVLLTDARLPANAGSVFPYLKLFNDPFEAMPRADVGATVFDLRGAALLLEVAAISTDEVIEVELWAGPTRLYIGPPRTSWTTLLPVPVTSVVGASYLRVIARTASRSNDITLDGFTVDAGPWPRVIL